MRLFILLLSAGCVALYGLALAGYAGYSFGHGRPDYIALGLLLGTLCGAAAIRFWKKWSRDAVPDVIIFDVDGVLIDTRDSFLLAVRETVRWCWENLLGGDADCEGYTLEYFNLCKKHPLFNDDAVVAWFLLRCMKRTEGKSMKAAFPSLKEWEKELKALDAALTPQSFEEAAEKTEPGVLPLSEVRSVMEEIYYGASLYAEYNGKPGRGIAGEGYWGMEKPAVDRHWKDFPLPVGIYTGRSKTEMAMARKCLGWEDFPEDMLITSDKGILKPSPQGLSILCERAGAQNPLFFGDTASDEDTWRAFGRGIFVAIGPILKAEARRKGIPHFDTLEKAVLELL